jgi:hypothetical protein
MTPRRFFLSSLILTLLLAASIVGANVLVDTYGYFRGAGNRRVRMYYNERLEKNLLSRRYVPENFNGLLIGASTSFNIDTARFLPLRIYNLSILAGTITEVKWLVDNYLEVRQPRLVIISMYPYMLRERGMKTAYLSERAVLGALGSLDILKRYAIAAWQDLSGEEPYNDFGYHEYEDPPRERSLELIREKAQDPDFPDTELAVDLFAWMEYLELVRELERSGARIILYLHPIPRPVYEAHHAFFDRFASLVTKALPEGSITVDFNTEAHRDLTGDLENFQDEVHLSGKGSVIMGQKLHEVLVEHLNPADFQEPEEPEEEE